MKNPLPGVPVQYSAEIGQRWRQGIQCNWKLEKLYPPASREMVLWYFHDLGHIWLSVPLCGVNLDGIFLALIQGWFTRDPQEHGTPENGKRDPYKLPISLGIRKWEWYGNSMGPAYHFRGSHFWGSLKSPLTGPFFPKTPPTPLPTRIGRNESSNPIPNRIGMDQGLNPGHLGHILDS